MDGQFVIALSVPAEKCEFQHNVDGAFGLSYTDEKLRVLF